MNEMINKFLLAGEEFMPKMHLRQPGFAYSTCGRLTKNKERIQKFLETEDSKYIYQNKLDKAYFQHGIAYGDLKIYQEEQLKIKHYVIKYLTLLKILNMMDINIDLLQWFINFLIKKLLVVLLKMKSWKAKN